MKKKNIIYMDGYDKVIEVDSEILIFSTKELSCNDASVIVNNVIDTVVNKYNNDASINDIDNYLLNESQCTQEDREIIVEGINKYIESLLMTDYCETKNIKSPLQLVYDECMVLFKQGDASAVCDHVLKEQKANNPLYEDVKYKRCTACDNGQPVLNNICLICGSNVQPQIGRKVTTIGEVRELIKNLNNRDFAVLEACDKDGEVEDLYPMYIDVIENIKLKDGTMVNEVRFCQMPNTVPEVKLENLPETIVVPIADIPKIEKWAEEMSETLYEMRAESDLGGASLTTPNTNNAVPHSFIESTVDDVEHIENMKEKIRLDIVQNLKTSPSNYMNEKGEYEYDMDVYGFAYVVDSYIEQLYEDTQESKKVWVCPDCGSDNVHTRKWVGINDNVVHGTTGEDEDWCDDCKGLQDIVLTTLIPRAKVIGFTVTDVKGDIIHPDAKNHSNVFNLAQAKQMMNKQFSTGSIIWRLKAIWTADIECPVMMFEGNVR